MNGQRSQVVGGLAETLSWRPTLFESSSGEAQGWLDFSALTARTSWERVSGWPGNNPRALLLAGSFCLDAG